MVVTLHVSVHQPDPAERLELQNLSTLLELYFAAGVPFLMSGFALTIAIASAGDGIGRIYAYDLVGRGGSAVCSSIPSISLVGRAGARS